jgi:hypothetical protein
MKVDKPGLRYGVGGPSGASVKGVDQGRRRHVMARVPSAVVAAGGLVGGYGVARWTKKRQLGGAVLAVAGAAAAQQWRQRAGGKAAGALTAAYVAAFAGSHPLARKVGAWPSVFGVAGAVALASWAVADRRGLR